MVFWFEESDVFSGRQVHIDAWRYAARAGGIQSVRCINKTNHKLNMGNEDFDVIGETDEDFINWCDENSSDNLVFFDTPNTCPDSAIQLRDLDHKAVDWYVFGAGSGFPRVYSKDHNSFIEYTNDKNCCYLPTNKNTMLHPLHIGSCVMLRRFEEIGGYDGC